MNYHVIVIHFDTSPKIEMSSKVSFSCRRANWSIVNTQGSIIQEPLRMHWSQTLFSYLRQSDGLSSIWSKFILRLIKFIPDLKHSVWSILIPSGTVYIVKHHVRLILINGWLKSCRVISDSTNNVWCKHEINLSKNIHLFSPKKRLSFNYLTRK